VGARDPDLVVNLETALPASVPAPSATALFCFGTCFHRRDDVTALAIEVDGRRHPASAHGMPRPDLFAALHPRLGGSTRRDPTSADDPGVRCFRSGFWATASIEAREPGTLDVSLVARLGRGGERSAPLGRIAVADRSREHARTGSGPPGLIAVCMATFEPDPELFAAQVQSLREQTERQWVCVISDDCSRPEHVARIESVIAGDPRFTFSRSDRRQGFYRNFERALLMAPREAQLLALCDQDDRWFPDKLEVLRRALGPAQLVYSDQRLVDGGGRVLRESLWEGRRNNHTDLASLLVANTITGAATLFRREVADLAVPFPETPGMQFHDHWLALVALASGDVAYVDRALYDYVQHRGAVFGEVTSGSGSPRAASWRTLARGGRGAYFLGYLARQVAATVLLLRCRDRLTPRKRRALERYIAAERSPAACAWLSLRALRVLLGRTETLGSETELVRGIVWRWLVALATVGARRPGRIARDASFPAPSSFEQKRLRRWRARA
jgi:hypothetical protein